MIQCHEMNKPEATTALEEFRRERPPTMRRFGQRAHGCPGTASFAERLPGH
jgi:hypothetical protein